MTDQPPRSTLVDLAEEVCFELLVASAVGRLGFVTESGTPSILPINHLVDSREILFRTAPGSKLSVALREPGAEVVYEIDDYDASNRSGWSVVVRGRIEPILDQIRIAHLDRKGHHTWVDDLERTNWVRIVPESVTGRRIARPGDSGVPGLNSD